MSIADRIQAINDHLVDDYKVLRLAGADLTGVNKNIINLKMSWKERLLYFMNNGTDIVWNNWNKVNGTGTSLSLNNTEEAPMSLTYKGNTSQSGTPTPSSPIPVQVVSGDNSIEVVGKNLFDYTQAPKITTSGGTTTQIIENGIKVTTLNAGQYKYAVYRLFDASSMVGEQITLTLNASKSSNNNYQVNVIFCDENGENRNTFQTLQNQNINYTFTIPSISGTSKYLGLTFYGNGNSTEGNAGDYCEYTNIQLEKGNQATTYEEYKSASYPISLSSKNLIPNEVVLPLGTYGGATVVTLLDFGEDKTFSNLTLSFNFKDAMYTNSSGAFIDFIKNDGTHQYNLAGSFGISPNVNINGTKYLKRTSEITFRKLNVHVLGYANFTQGFISEAMLVEGTQELPYEAYFTPIELCKIGTYQDKIDKITGKNLFDKDNANVLNAYIGQTGTISAGTGDRTIYISCKPNTTYTIQKMVQGTLANNRFRVGTSTSTPALNGAVSQYYNAGNGNNTTSYTITTNDSAKYLVFNCYYDDSATTFNTMLGSIMISESTSTQNYEPYGTNWYLKKEIGKVKLSGNWNWSVANTGTANYIYYAYPSPAIYVKSGTSGLCTHYPYTTIGNDTNQGIFWANTFFRVRYGTEEPIADYKTWLNNNNILFYYVLATPTYETITDTTLIGQLEALKKSYEGQTNISQVNNDLPFELDVTALEVMS